MRDNDYPTEVSDPEASGLPDTVDPDSSAYDEVESSRWADGADPAALPGSGPGGSNRFGVTEEEARQGEGFEARLRQEEPDVGAESERVYEETVGDSAQRQLDADVWGESPTSDPNSAVSLYDDGQLDADSPRPVGRLVETDEGYGTDDEADSIAYDAGAAGGGATAEEAAMHETNGPNFR